MGFVEERKNNFIFRGKEITPFTFPNIAMNLIIQPGCKPKEGARIRSAEANQAFTLSFSSQYIVYVFTDATFRVINDELGFGYGFLYVLLARLCAIELLRSRASTYTKYKIYVVRLCTYVYERRRESFTM